MIDPMDVQKKRYGVCVRYVVFVDVYDAKQPCSPDLKAQQHEGALALNRGALLRLV